MELSESFYIFLTTTTACLFLAFVKLIYDSKCKKINICGVQIERDTQTERDIEHDRLEHGTPTNPIETRRELASIDRINS